MIGAAVGYQLARLRDASASRSRCREWDPGSKRDVMALAYATRDAIGRLYKVLPTAIVAERHAPVDSPRSELGGPHCRPARTADRGRRQPRRPPMPARSPIAASRELEERGVIAVDAGDAARPRPAGAALLRTDARAPHRAVAAGAAEPLMLDALSKSFFHALAGKRRREADGLDLRHAQPEQLRAALHRRRNDRGSHRRRRDGSSRAGWR